jgi:thiamine-phosphate pyrophosphorylase
MARCYSDLVKRRHRLPLVWLVSDARNDDRLEAILRRLPRGSGLIFRHYHLDPEARRGRFDALAILARTRGHLVVLAGSAREARRWGASGCYCSPEAGSSRRSQGLLIRLITAHCLREIGMANRARADAILLSPVFPTRSHPGASPLGAVRFRLLARHSRVPVIALGGMNRHRARVLGHKNWAAIDGI